MNRTQAIRHITATTSIKQVNLPSKIFSADQVKNLAQEGQVIMTLEQLETIFVERNEKAANNSRLALENNRLKDELAEREKGKNAFQIVKKSLVDLSDDELKLLGLVPATIHNAQIDDLLDRSKQMQEQFELMLKMLDSQGKGW